jgi:predicted aspartyl protease
MVLKFSFKVEKSTILGTIHRPVAQVFFWSNQIKQWTEIWMIVDTGADYTLLPRFMANKLGVTLEKDCKIFNTYGVGGGERVYFLPKIKIKLGEWERIIPVGFLERNEVPPLMGRHLFLETFETLFSSNHKISFCVK